MCRAFDYIIGYALFSVLLVLSMLGDLLVSAVTGGHALFLRQLKGFVRQASNCRMPELEHARTMGAFWLIRRLPWAVNGVLRRCPVHPQARIQETLIFNPRFSGQLALGRLRGVSLRTTTCALLH